jgi:hypothetical protein
LDEALSCRGATLWVSDHTVVKQLWPKASKPLGARLALDAVLLDAGGVLILPHAGRLTDALSPLGIAPPDRAAVERAPKQRNDQPWRSPVVWLAGDTAVRGAPLRRGA